MEAGLFPKEDLRRGRRLDSSKHGGIETVLTRFFEEDTTRCQILNIETGGMKIHRDLIIISEFMNIYERNKILFGRGKNRRANMVNGQTLTTTYLHSTSPSVLFSTQSQISKVRCDMSVGTGILIPRGIWDRLWRRCISL